ncbi:hypothetical protein [Siphonobacter sp.]|uniref:hypothetical protein n=1 Tax=Siphonobacter sp. TaxID=1869184 RepID=UPI003B3BCBBE
MAEPVWIRILLLVSWFLVLLYVWGNQKRTENAPWLFYVLIGLVLLSRSSNIVQYEPNVDTSTWLTSTLTIRRASDPVWTWLNYTDGRPFTVAPLWLASLLGLPLTYGGAEWLSVILWCITLVALAGILKALGWKSGRAFIFVAALAAFVGTTGYIDHVAYNSEVASMWLLALALWGFFYWAERPVTWGALVVGVLLGLLPYAKFQNAPMGLVVAAFAGFTWLRSRQWMAVVLLGLGGLLPTLGFVAYYAGLGQLETFWNHYFLYYFYYSYTDEFSKLTTWERFTPVRFLYLTLASPDMRWYAAGLLLATAGLFVHFLRKTKTTYDWLALVLLLTTYYAMLQSGNNFHHYALYVPFLVPVALGIWARDLPIRTQKTVLSIVLLAAGFQAGYNLNQRGPVQPTANEPLTQRVASVIRANSKPEERMVLWGWFDRLYVYAQRPMGYRYPYTIGIFWPSPLHDVRVKDFIHDLEENQPAIFVDVCGTALTFYGTTAERHEATPEVARYIASHYRLIQDIEGVRVYKRLHP